MTINERIDRVLTDQANGQFYGTYLRASLGTVLLAIPESEDEMGLVALLEFNDPEEAIRVVAECGTMENLKRVIDIKRRITDEPGYWTIEEIAGRYMRPAAQALADSIDESAANYAIGTLASYRP